MYLLEMKLYLLLVLSFLFFALAKNEINLPNNQESSLNIKLMMVEDADGNLNQFISKENDFQKEENQESLPDSYKLVPQIEETEIKTESQSQTEMESIYETDEYSITSNAYNTIETSEYESSKENTVPN